MLKLYVYGYLNQVQPSRKPEREAGRKVEVMWLTGKLVPDFKTIADFRRDNDAAIRATCRKFVDMPAVRAHRQRRGRRGWQPPQGSEHTG
jgi:transposase